MAEVALGGIQIAVRVVRDLPGSCEHAQTMSTLNGGVERQVCEQCGYLSIRFHSSLTGTIDRDRFARPADQSTSEAAVDMIATLAPAPATARYGFHPEVTRDIVTHRPQATALQAQSPGPWF